MFVFVCINIVDSRFQLTWLPKYIRYVLVWVLNHYKYETLYRIIHWTLISAWHTMNKEWMPCISRRNIRTEWLMSSQELRVRFTSAQFLLSSVFRWLVAHESRNKYYFYKFCFIKKCMFTLWRLLSCLLYKFVFVPSPINIYTSCDKFIGP